MTKINRQDAEEFYVKEFLKEYGRTDYMSDILKQVKQHKYGENPKGSRLLIDWASLFNSNKCPACPGDITLEASKYVCKRCGFLMDAETYHGAAKQYHEKMEESQVQKTYSEKLIKSGYTQEEVTEVILTAAEKAIQQVGGGG